MDFTFVEEPGVGRPFQLAARAAAPPAMTVAAVLSTAWLYSDGVQNLLPQLSAPEGGQGWEEAAEWEKFPDGAVVVRYLREEARIPAGDFAAVVRAMAGFHLEVARTREVDGPLEKFIRRWLEEPLA